MKYLFTINSAKYDDEFFSALRCARDSIESILIEYQLIIKIIDKNIIEISLAESSELQQIPFDLNECKKIIKPAFTSSDGNTYPEFLLVESAEVDN